MRGEDGAEFERIERLIRENCGRVAEPVDTRNLPNAFRSGGDCETGAAHGEQIVKAELHGIQMIATERVRQVAEKDYSAGHEDGHDGGELAMAAACYASPCSLYVFERDGDEELRFIDPWPFDASEDLRAKIRRSLTMPQRDGEGLRLTPLAWRIQLLAKAGALVAAEIDRLVRIGESSQNSEEGE